MKILSYAQNLEDILLNRVFADRSSGFYIDVGACLPIDDSVTKLFYEHGWHGINIEPQPTFFEVLARDRPRDINLPVGLSNREGTLVFYEVPADRGISTFSAEQAEEYRRAGREIIERSVPVTTLARVCEEYDVPTIDFLKIDVESHEHEVLEGADWERHRPRVVVIEATRPYTTVPTHERWESLILSADYLFAFFDGLNRYYVRAEDRELVPVLSVPANFFDDFERFSHQQRVQNLEREVVESRRWAEHLQTTVNLQRDELSSARAEIESTRATLRELDGRLADLQAELATARARLDLFEGWGPMTVSVVRRLRRISSRLPLAKSLLRRAIRIRRELLAAMASGPVPR